MLFYTYLPNEPLSKDRVEAFSDGVYAIVATLLILDIWFVPLLSSWVSKRNTAAVIPTWWRVVVVNCNSPPSYR